MSQTKVLDLLFFRAFSAFRGCKKRIPTTEIRKNTERMKNESVKNLKCSCLFFRAFSAFRGCKKRITTTKIWNNTERRKK
jgi:hypothetical protein